MVHSLTHSLTVSHCNNNNHDRRPTDNRQTDGVGVVEVGGARQESGRSVGHSFTSFRSLSFTLFVPKNSTIQQFKGSRSRSARTHARTHTRTALSHAHERQAGRQLGRQLGRLAGLAGCKLQTCKQTCQFSSFLPACLPSFLPALHSPTKPAQTQTLRKDAAPPGPSPAQRGPAQPKGKNERTNEERKKARGVNFPRAERRNHLWEGMGGGGACGRAGEEWRNHARPGWAHDSKFPSSHTAQPSPASRGDE